MSEQHLDPHGVPLPSPDALPPAAPDDADAAPLPRWALVTAAGRVFTVVQQADEPDVDGCASVPVLAGSVVSPGDSFDGEGFVPPQVQAAPRHVTRLAFLQRFLDSEAIAIDLASIGATPQAAAVRRYLQLVNAATYIDLDRLDTRAGVIALETSGLLQEGRALEILDTPLSDGERAGGAR